MTAAAKPESNRHLGYLTPVRLTDGGRPTVLEELKVKTRLIFVAVSGLNLVIQIESLYSRAALRHRISSRSSTGTSAKLFSIMRVLSG